MRLFRLIFIATDQANVVTIFTFLLVLFLTGLIKYLPQHLSIMNRRVAYYLWGQEGDESAVWHWIMRPRTEL